MDEIVAFADLHEFIDQPIRTYSTGMVARLAFAVATTVDAQHPASRRGPRGG